MAVLTPALLIALCLQLAWTRNVVNLASEAKARELDAAKTWQDVAEASTDLLTAIGNLRDEIKAERIARGTAEDAARCGAPASSVHFRGTGSPTPHGRR
jgi:hypothetical protein